METVTKTPEASPLPNWLKGQSPDDIYRSPLEIAWTFDYLMSGDKIEDLYRRAKQDQWNSDERLPWDLTVDPSKPLINDEQDIYHRMPFFQKLSKSQQERFTAHSTAQLLSQFLHGEQGALMTAACVTHSVPDATAKLYAATQTMDEARHVEVFARYCDKVAMVYPMSGWLKQLIDATLKADRYEKIMIGMNMIVEGLALGAFNNMYRSTQCELLKQLTFNVMRDESRHVSFGHAYLAPVIAGLAEDEVEGLADFAFEAVSILAFAGTAGTIASRIDPGFMMVLENCEIDADDFFAGLREAEQLGITRQLPPGQIHSLEHLMLPALARVGLLTRRVRGRYEEAGIPIPEDPRILHAMEGGHPVPA
ncbi:MAG: ferritin-like domain-containing protein [Alphaproteobacteria bacterium]|nr:ferritin-like domain-containing protein [Alphaproteobacteria bacterium]